MACWSVPPEVLAQATRLRWLQAGCSGVNRQLSPASIASPVALTREEGLGGLPLAAELMAPGSTDHRVLHYPDRPLTAVPRGRGRQAGIMSAAGDEEGKPW